TLYYKAFDALKIVAPDPKEGTADKDVAKIVVFIDDLDRCMPEKAVRLLESIKLVLTQKGFIYAIALDRPVIERFIDVAFRKALDDPKLTARGARYLDKIIQLPLELPSHADRFADYVRATMDRGVFQANNDNRQLAQAIEPLMQVIGPAIEFNPR